MEIKTKQILIIIIVGIALLIIGFLGLNQFGTLGWNDLSGDNNNIESTGDNIEVTGGFESAF